MEVAKRFGDLSKRQVLLLAGAVGTLGYAGYKATGYAARLPSQVHSVAGEAAQTVEDTATGDGE